MRALPLVLLLLLSVLAPPAKAAPLDDVVEQSVTWMSEYLKVDTTVPPGNETKGARYLKSILDREGIASEILEFEPGRGNLLAVLKGKDPKKPALMLLNHIDVVPADPRYWKVPPFSGAIQDGAIWGRGALDMKGLGLIQLAALVALQREGVQLDRDVIYLATGDEEEGGAGLVWMMKNRPQLFQNLAGVINEEGPGFVKDGKLQYWEVRPGQKGLVWVRLTARGKPGHGSLPTSQAATHRLVRALNRIQAWQTPVKVLPEARTFFTSLSKGQPPKEAAQLKDLARSLEDPAFRAWFESNPIWNAMVRNTISITKLGGSNKTNVIPPEATAELDCRLLPGEDTTAFLADLTRVIDDPEITVDPFEILYPVPASPVDTELFKAIERGILRYHPDALIVTPFSRAANDSRFLQAKSIVAYGFYPFTITFELFATEHGNDERIPVDSLKEGVRMLHDIVLDFAGAKP